MPKKENALQKSTPKTPQKKQIDVFKDSILDRVTSREPIHQLLSDLKKLNKKLIRTRSIKKQNEIYNQMDTLFLKGEEVLSLDTKKHIHPALPPEHVPFATQLCCELEKEFEAKTPSEKMLAHIAAFEYCRIFICSRHFHIVTQDEFIGQAKAHFLSIQGKVIERSERQIIAALQALKQMKTPPVKVNIKTKNAFVAEKQQNIGNVSKNNDPQ